MPQYVGYAKKGKKKEDMPMKGKKMPMHKKEMDEHMKTPKKKKK